MKSMKMLSLLLTVVMTIVVANGSGKCSTITKQAKQPALVDRQKTNNLLLKVVSIGAREVDLTWQNNSTEHANFYKVYRAKTAHFVVGKTSGIVVFTIPTSRRTLQFFDPKAKPDTNYFYRVVMYSASNRIVVSNTVAVRTKPFKALPKPQPTSLKLNGISPLRVISLSWTPYKGKDFLSYNIYRDTVPGFIPNDATLLDQNEEATQSQWTDISIAANATLKMAIPHRNMKDEPLPITVYYKIGVYKSDYRETFSNEIAVSLPTPSNKLPTPSILSSKTVSNSRAMLKWTTPDNLNVIGYQLHRSKQSGFVPSHSTIVGGDYDANFEGKLDSVRSSEDKGLQPQTKYFYKIVTFNIDGLTAVSNELEITTLTVPQPTLAPLPVTLKLVSPPTYDSISLQWTKSDDPNFYSYDLCLLNDSTDVPELDVNQAPSDINDTSFEYDLLSEGTTYYYVVVVRNKFDQTTVSNVVKATTRQHVPRPIKLEARADRGHSAIQIKPNGTQTSTKIAPQRVVDLSWTGQFSDDSGRYSIYRGDKPQFSTTKESLLISFGAGEAGWNDLTVQEGRTYFYKIIYTANNGQTLSSNEAKVTIPVLKALNKGKS